jgi:c-di-GMP-binding flagellar brake protein YcgR
VSVETVNGAFMSQPLKVWERIELVVGDPPDTGRYLSRIQDFINGGIIITEPEFLDGTTLLREEIDVRVLVTREDAVYQFSSRIKRMLSHSSREYLLSPPRRFERVQRRMFARVAATKKLSYAVIVPLGDWQNYDDRLVWEQSQTVDMSGGGLQFRTRDHVAVMTPLLVKVDFFKELNLPEVVAAIARRSYQKENDFFCGAEFLLNNQLHLHLSESQKLALPKSVSQFDRNSQNRLSSYVFNLQVNLRQKGLL